MNNILYCDNWDKLVADFFKGRTEKSHWSSEVRARFFLSRKAKAVEEVIDMIKTFEGVFQKDMGGIKKYQWGLDVQTLEDFVIYYRFHTT